LAQDQPGGSRLLSRRSSSLPGQRKDDMSLKTVAPWTLAGVLAFALLLSLWPSGQAASLPGQETAASASCIGLLNIGSCNVQAEAQQQPVTKAPKTGLSDLAGYLGLIVIAGAGAFALGAWLTRDSLYSELEQGGS